MSRTRWTIRVMRDGLRSNGLLRLLVLAAVFHIALMFSIYLAGRFSLWPGMFDTNGTLSVSDNRYYQPQMALLVNELNERGIGWWARSPYPLHLKLYSISYALLHPIFGFTTLSGEPVNLLLYLIILTLVFVLGRKLFDPRSAMLAASIVALWPTFLLHTTQLFRDPLVIIAVLVLVLVNVCWLTNLYSVQRGALLGIIGGAASALLWIIRNQMWSIVVAIAVLGTVVFVARQIIERRALFGNMVGVATALVAVLNVPVVVGSFQTPDMFLPKSIVVNGKTQTQTATVSQVDEEKANQAASVEDNDWWWARLVPLIDGKREGFAAYAEKGANIDAEVKLDSARAVMSYLPRALSIGLFAPFPEMWLAHGQVVGRAGRFITGLETLLMYFIELLALYSIWQKRHNLSVWFLVFVVIMSATAFGLVIVNVGALYRMRYAFWMLLVVLGASGARQLLSARVSHKRPLLEESVSLT